MLNNHAKILAFFSQVGEVTGRKKLQKMIYILQACGVPFEEKYQFHFYGPYSEELSLRIQELCNLGFMNETKEEKSSYVQYRYNLTEDGARFLQQSALDMPDYKAQADMLMANSSRFLELVATMLFFRDLPQDEVEKKVQKVKPKQHYTAEEFARAWKMIGELVHENSVDGIQNR
ncbi:YwgA family protein [Virgibacillus sp. 179-BFC.A HS]|uniref:YwgA family protein n=1 Tax=Tigheibacillus jepli TaxID=3035914 RepID=A0ABU5CE76_9BACI|nr:YwgA family protein [Virgibacillus sp. 179-BFC.A HS]MDY0404525.1 YwgA family protein [Virgibacillus sp. 179-BFC.A HS]